MAVISHTKTEQGGVFIPGTPGNPLVGGATIHVKTTKEILFSYTSTDGTAVVEEGSSGGNCYKVTRQPHSLNWTARIKTRTEVTTQGPIRFTIHLIAKGIEIGGATGTIIGGGVFVVGLAADADIITLPAGLALNIIGGGIAIVSGIFWALGGIVSYFTEPVTKVTNTNSTESGSKAYTSVKMEQFECLPGTTYTPITLPTETLTPEQAEDSCVMDVLGGL